MRYIITIAVIVLLAVAGLAWHYQGKIFPKVADETEKIQAPEPDPITYSVLTEEIDFHRTKLAKRYQQARTEQEKRAVIQSARELLELTLPALMRCWLGTPWDFNGTAAEPGDGKIACGYFVSTVLRDAGFNVQRFKLAQQPSQTIIRTFLPHQEMRIRVGKDYRTYMREVQSGNHGVYIIGLDKHVGFLINDSTGLHFLHSGGIHKRVVDESIAEAQTIKASKYRVIGNITSNEVLLRRWLMNAPFPTAR